MESSRLFDYSDLKTSKKWENEIRNDEYVITISLQQNYAKDEQNS